MAESQWINQVDRPVANRRLGMKCRIVLIFLFLITTMSCSAEVSTDSVKVSPTPRQTAPVATTSQPVETPASRNENRPSRVIKGGPLCENYLLAKIGSLKDPDTQLLKLKGFSVKKEALSPDLKKWLKTANAEKLVSFELKSDVKKVLVLGSRNIEATGLASNLEYWAVEVDDHLIEFQSLSDNPRLIFWDKNGFLNYFVVDFSSEFIEQRDFDHPSLDLRMFIMNDEGKPQLQNEERNVKCR